MKLRSLPESFDPGCFRVYVRVDWNIPLSDGLGSEDSLKLTRTYPLLDELHRKGAIVLLLTHVGRPKGREAAYSTKKLAKIASAHSGLPVKYLDVDLGSDRGRQKFALDVDRLQPGDIALLENVRFQAGEEANDAKLVQAYAMHADVFMNDAFASCHRAHASVAGLAAALPSYAGPALREEVDVLSKLLMRPKRPYIAVVGGAKLTSKLPVLKALLKTADKVMVGGAMAHAFFAAKKLKIGKSFVEKEGVPVARALLRQSKLLLPQDVLVAKKIAPGAMPKRVELKGVGATESIVDIGTDTMRAWAAELRRAKTILWNGPLGIAEIPSFSHGSLVIGRAIAARAKGKAFGVAGGGDTLPVVAKTGMQEWFDFVSTGGGAMLEYISLNGKLPGIQALQGAGKKSLPKAPRSTLEQGITCATGIEPVRAPAKAAAKATKKPAKRPASRKPAPTSKRAARKKS